jgi:hypothetical protein
VKSPPGDAAASLPLVPATSACCPPRIGMSANAIIEKSPVNTGDSFPSCAPVVQEAYISAWGPAAAARGACATRFRTLRSVVSVVCASAGWRRRMGELEAECALNVLFTSGSRCFCSDKLVVQ